MLGGFRLGFSIALVLACSACASFGQSPHGRAAKSEAIWSGVSGGYRWQWTTMDLSAARAAGGKAVFSARAFERRTSQQLKDQQIDPVDSYVECSIAPLSVVGSIASYERDYYWEGGAHPSGSTDYVCVDASRPGRQLSLTDLFPDAVIVRALLADKIVADILKREHVTEMPRTTAQLVGALKGKTFGGDENYKFGFAADMLSRFAFHHVEGDRVAVRLNVSWGTEIYRFTTTQIGLLLPIPARLRSPLQLAADRRQGFLMADSKKLARGKSTRLFQYGKAPK